MQRSFVTTTGIAALALLTAGAPDTYAKSVIDFESLSNGEAVDDQFLSLGVDFNGDGSALREDGTLSPAFPPASGQTLLFDDPTLSNGILRMDAVNSKWKSAGGRVTGNRSITLKAFDDDDNLLASDSTPGPNFLGNDEDLSPNIALSVEAQDIAYVTFSDNGSDYTVDDFHFEPMDSAAIPSPIGGLTGLTLFGLLGTSGRQIARARKRQDAETTAN